MKWPTKLPDHLWTLTDRNNHIIGFAFDSTLPSMSHGWHRAVRYDRATSEEDEAHNIGSRALEQLDLFND